MGIHEIQNPTRNYYLLKRLTKRDKQYKTKICNKRTSMEQKLLSAETPEEIQSIQSEINSFNLEIELYEQNHAYGHFIRSKSYFIEHNQKTLKYFSI